MGIFARLQCVLFTSGHCFINQNTKYQMVGLIKRIDQKMSEAVVQLNTPSLNEKHYLTAAAMIKFFSSHLMTLVKCFPWQILSDKSLFELLLCSLKKLRM